MRKIKPVSFNMNDPFERGLLEHTTQFSNFSGYIKRLIQRDKEGGYQRVTPQQERKDVKDLVKSFV